MKVSYSSDLGIENFRLVELPEELRTEDGSWADGVWIKGEEDEDAVLCTRKRTYSVRMLESSNTCLLGTRPQEGGEIEAVAELSGVIHLDRCPPKLDQLKNLLETKDFFGDEEEMEKIGYTFEEISQRVGSFSSDPFRSNETDPPFYQKPKGQGDRKVGNAVHY